MNWGLEWSLKLHAFSLVACVTLLFISVWWRFPFCFLDHNWTLLCKKKIGEDLIHIKLLIRSDQISRSVVSNSLWPHELQHTRPPCPSPTPGVHSDSRPLSQWCHPAISSSVVPFSSCPQSLPASESFPMSQLRLYFWGLQNHCRWWLQPWN